MRRSLLIKNCQTFSARKTKNIKSKNCHLFGAKLAFSFLLIITVFSSLGYVFQINQLATMGQEINRKESSLDGLKEANKSLEIRIAQLKSSYQFEEERERLNLVNPVEVSFVEIEKNNKVAMIQ